MLFNEGNVPDFGSIQIKSNDTNIYYLLAQDIPKLNGMLTKAASRSYLSEGESFDLDTGALAFVVDYKTAGSGKIYAYHRGRDYWYEFNIRSDLGLCELMWNRHETILRETKTISGTPPLSFESNGRPLKNYRIYGNTVNGESVGDLVTDTNNINYGKYKISVTVKSINLFNPNSAVCIHTGPQNWTNGSQLIESQNFIVIPFNCNQNTTYTVKKQIGNRLGVWAINSNNTADILFSNNYRVKSAEFNSESHDTVYITIHNNSTEHIEIDEIYQGLMIVEGTEIPEKHIPYYDSIRKVIYLDRPLRKIYGQADWIDYKKQKLFIHRKNSFSSELEQGNILNDGTLADSPTRLRTKDYISCENGTYVVSFLPSNCKFGYRCYDENYNFLGSTGQWVTNGQPFTITIPNTKYIKMNFAKENQNLGIVPSEITELQLEKGELATSYEPFITDTEISVSLPKIVPPKGIHIVETESNIQPSGMEIYYNQ